MRAVDAYGFGGGFTMGVVQAGFELVGKREPTTFGVPALEANRHLLGDKWQAQVADPREWEPVDDVQLVFGNPPCSGFSLMSISAGSGAPGKRVDYRGIDAPVNACMWNFADYAARCDAPIAIFESVSAASKMGLPLMRRLRASMEEKTGRRYDLTHVVHDAASLGGAALRKRYFFVCHRVPFGVEPYPLEAVPTLRESLGDLDQQPLQWQPHPYVQPPTWWTHDLRSPDGEVDGHALHRMSVHHQRVQALLDTGLWGVDDRMSVVAKRVYDRDGRLPDPFYETMTDAKIDKLLNLGGRGNQFQPTRWSPDKCGYVLHGGAVAGSFVHPWKDRILTYREGARILGYPDAWKMEVYRDTSGAYAWLGKGISVQCGRWIGEWAYRSLEGEPGELIGDETDHERERWIDVSHDYKMVYNRKTGGRVGTGTSQQAS